MIQDKNMSSEPAFAEALDAAEQLAPDDQIELIEILSRRLAERGRQRVATTVAESRREFEAGTCEKMAAFEIVNEAQS
jgi:hypothetical protein